MTEGPPLSRLMGWLVGCVAAGFLIAYNILRVGGDDPSAAAGPAAVVGGIAGAAVFAVGYLVLRRLWASGRTVYHQHVVPADTSELDDATRDLLRIGVYALAAAAAAAIAVGAGMAFDYLQIEGARPRGTLLLIAWDVVFGLWIADEAMRIRRGGGDGLDAIFFGCLLTCVLAGVAISRDVLPAAQVALIVFAGLAGLATGLAMWRVMGARGLPFAAVTAVVVAAGSIAFPLAG